MLVALIVIAFWGLCLLLTAALCAAARRGDKQVDPSLEAAFPVPAPSVPESTPEVSVVRVGADTDVARGPQTAADLALQSG
jgi:hypothetical protein